MRQGTRRGVPAAGHIAPLDGVRGVAVLLVLSYHLAFFGRLTSLSRHLPALKPLTTVVMAGWSGVDLFFVLSGFLITRILLRTRGRPGSLRVFFARRALRIFPLYFCALAVHYLWLLPAFPGLHASSPGSGLWLASYLGNLRVAVSGWDSLPLPLQHFWSLAIEEQYYLLWPLVVGLLPPRSGVRLCAALCALSLASRVGLVLAGEPLAAYVMTPGRLDGLALGSLLAYCCAQGRLPPEAVRRWLGAGAALGLAGIVAATGALRFEEPLWTPSVGLTLTSLLYFSFVASCVSAPEGWLARWMAGRGLRWLGRYSYGIYVWHQPVLLLMVALRVPGRYLPPGSPPLAAFAAWCASGCVLAGVAAWVSYHGLERHFLRLKDRWVPNPR